MIKSTYDKKNDILFIYKDDEKTKGSLDVFPGFVVDISHSNKVVGLEIMNASKFFNISKTDFEKLKIIRLSTIMKTNYYGFTLIGIFEKHRIMPTNDNITELTNTLFKAEKWGGSFK